MLLDSLVPQQNNGQVYIALGWYSSEQDVREPVDDGDS